MITISKNRRVNWKTSPWPEKLQLNVLYTIILTYKCALEETYINIKLNVIYIVGLYLKKQSIVVCYKKMCYYEFFLLIRLVFETEIEAFVNILQLLIKSMFYEFVWYHCCTGLFNTILRFDAICDMICNYLISMINNRDPEYYLVELLLK